MTLWLPLSMCSLHTQHLLAAAAVVLGPPEAGIQDSTGRSQEPTWRDLPTGRVSHTSKKFTTLQRSFISGKKIIRWLFSHSVLRRIFQILNVDTSTEVTLKHPSSTRQKGAPDMRGSTNEVYYMEIKASLSMFAFIHNFTNPGEMNKQTKFSSLINEI